MKSILWLAAAISAFVVFAGLRSRSEPIPSAHVSQYSESEVSEALDSPEQALRWRYMWWRDEKGQIPKDGLRNALKQRDSNLLHWQSAGVSPHISPWVSLGPTNFGGRALSLAINPADSNILFLGTAGGGVWKSLDAGLHWAKISDRWASIAIGAIVYDPNNAAIMYAGTGEGNTAVDQVQGAGVYKSVDGGTTWSLLPASAGLTNINAINVSPGNSNVVVAAVQPGGLFRSADGGVTWSKVLDAVSGLEIQFSKSNGNNAVATAEQYQNGWCHVAYYSSDRGVTWKTCGGDPARVDGYLSRLTVRYAPSNNNIVYLTSNFQNSYEGNFYKSIDGGHSYSLIGTYPINNQQGWYNNPLWVDPTNASFVIAGGINLAKSTNAGGSWTAINAGYIMTEQPHPDVHMVVSDPKFNGTSIARVYVVSDGGVHVASNIYTASKSAGWASLVNGLVTAQFYGAAGVSSNGLVVGGSQDNGTTAITTTNSICTLVAGGDGGYIAIDPTNSNYVYSSFPFLGINRSIKSGSSYSFQPIHAGITDADTAKANFISPFILSPNNVNVMWAGGDSLWRSTNVKASAPSWSAVKSPGKGYVSAISEAPGKAAVVWVGDSSGGVFRTSTATSAAPTWVTVSDWSGAVHPLPGRAISRILIDPSNSSVVYVALGGFGGAGHESDNLYKTTDSGAHWFTITGSGATALPKAPIYGIARNPQLPNSLYVATEVGLFGTADGGLTWSTSSFGPANVCCYDVNFMQGSQTLLLATHGRGLWTMHVPGIAGEVSALSVSNLNIICGGNVIGFVSLTGPAAAGGVVVNLTANDPSVNPSTVTIPAGQSSVAYTLSTNGIAAKKAVTITAKDSVAFAKAIVTVNPATLYSLTVVPNSVKGGTVTHGVVRLVGKAGPLGAKVSLTSTSPSATVPASVTVPKDKTSVSFAIGTKVVAANTAATIKAGYGTVSKTAVLTVTP